VSKKIKKENEGIPVKKCAEAEDKYNSMIRTKGVDWACWDI